MLKLFFLTLGIVLALSAPIAQAQLIKDYIPCAKNGDCGQTGTSKTRPSNDPDERSNEPTRTECKVDLLFTPLPLAVGQKQTIPSFRTSAGTLSWQIDNMEVLSFVGSSGNVSKVTVNGEAPGTTSLTVFLDCADDMSDQESVLIKVTCKGVNLADARRELEIFRNEHRRKQQEFEEASGKLKETKRSLYFQYTKIAARIAQLAITRDPTKALFLLNDIRSLKAKYENYKKALEQQKKALSDYKVTLLEYDRANRRLQCDSNRQGEAEANSDEIKDDRDWVDYELKQIDKDIQDAEDKIRQLDEWIKDLENMPGEINLPRS